MKKLITIVMLLIFVLSLAGCNNKDMNYIIENEPSIIGFVKDTGDYSILIENEDGEYSVSLNVENKDSSIHFNIGSNQDFQCGRNQKGRKDGIQNDQ